MIKQSDNYIAVKIRQGYLRFEISESGNVFGYKNFGESQQMTSDVDLRGHEIIGLISEIAKKRKNGIEVHSPNTEHEDSTSLVYLCLEVSSSEWNQWLIIKKGC